VAGSAGYRWDPAQYNRYARERARPFEDLVARIGLTAPRRILDVGCGPGSLTRSLLDRWPEAVVTGVDSSTDMIGAAQQHAVDGRLDFVLADVATWQPAEHVDVVVANAVLQWVPGHVELVSMLAGWLAPGGVLAFQVPDNFTDPSHTIVGDLRHTDRWRDRLDSGDRAAVERPETYLELLADLGLDPDVWQTTYLHLLVGKDPVLEWIKGTALRPVLDRLADDPDATTQFLAECGAELRRAYPPGAHGTVLPFRRTFAIGRRPEDR
jgi:trans-aconitate 2-methyltransferase